jgi:N-acetylglucosamine kinase-like BadF-type ATPase
MALVGIGVHSGGTNTTCALVHGDAANPEIVGETSNSISDVRGRNAIRATAEWIARVVLAHTQEHDEICVWIGAAASFPGVAAESVVEEFEASLKDLKALRPDCEVYIANDAVSLLKAPPTLGKGVAAIVGTGSIALGNHPAYDHVVRCGGHQFPVGDQGAGVWMTVEAVRLLIDEIESLGSLHYQSALLDRLCDYFDVSDASLKGLPDRHSPLTRADALAAKIAKARDDNKRYIAGFVHPHLLDLASGGRGPQDPVAARVVGESVDVVSQQIRKVSEVLAAYAAAAYTTDNEYEPVTLPLVVGGSIPANEFYGEKLQASLKECKYLEPVELIGDAAGQFSQLAKHFLRSPTRERKLVRRRLDQSHEVLQVL